MKMLKVRLQDQARASIFTYRTFISLKYVVHIIFYSKGCLHKRFGTYADVFTLSWMVSSVVFPTFLS